MSIDQSKQQDVFQQAAHESFSGSASFVAATPVTPVEALLSAQRVVGLVERFNATLEVESLLDMVLQEAIALAGAQGGCAGIYTPQGMVCHKYVQGDCVLPFDYRWSPGEGLPGWLIEHKVPYLTNDALSDIQSMPELYLKCGVHSVLSIPLLDAHGDLLGFFEVHNKQSDTGFSVSDQETLLTLSRLASVALSNVLTRQRLSQLQVGREQAEVAQRLFAAIVTSSDDAIISKTLEGIITSWNDAAVRVFGYTAEETIGRPIMLIIPPELESQEKAIIKKIRQGERIEQYETVRVTKAGNFIDVSLSISPVKDQQGKIIGAAKIARDITERKRLEAKYRHLFDSNLIGVFVSDFAGAFLDANDAFLDLLGYSREELLAGTLQRDSLTPDEMHWLSQNAVKALHEIGSSGTYEKEYLHKSGKRIPVLVAVTRIERTETCIGFVLDITERKRAEEQERFLAEVGKILASTLDYRETLANIAQLIVPRLADWFAVDLVDANGRFELAELAHRDPERVRWARALRERYPIDPAAPTGTPRVVRTGQAELYADIPDELLVASARSEEELAIARQIGYSSVMIVPLVARGKTLGVVTFVAAESGRKYDERDLSLAEEVGRRAGVALDNVRLYQAVQEARDQLEVILQGVADGIFVYGRSGKLVYANEAAAQLLGYVSVQELLQGPRSALASKYEIVDEQGQPLPDTHLTHKRVFAGEAEVQTVIGYTRKGAREPERWSLVKSCPVYDEQGAPLYVITIVHDITERVQAERRKDEFISMASHELKTPVTSLKGFTYVLQRRLRKQNDEQGLHYLARMDTQLDKLTTLISDLLDISRMQTGKMELQLAPVDLDALIAETVENIQITTSTHRLHVEGEAHAPILGDRDRLGQVLINLIMNAIKYSPGADRVIVHVLREQEHVIVRVQDFGIGIDEIHQQKIFERFYQVTDPEEKTYPGLGIGLYISKGIVERHGGRIEAHSRKGEGSTFSIILPLLQENK